MNYYGLFYYGSVLPKWYSRSKQHNESVSESRSESEPRKMDIGRGTRARRSVTFLHDAKLARDRRIRRHENRCSMSRSVISILHFRDSIKHLNSRLDQLTFQQQQQKLIHFICIIMVKQTFLG